MGKKLQTRNRYVLYEAAVQSVDFDVDFYGRMFRQRAGRIPLTLREDFCGTFSLCCAWASSRPDRSAIGLDLAKTPLAHGFRYHYKGLPEATKKRVTILRKNVLAKTKPVDLIIAQNFSYLTFLTRAELTRYFKFCRASLKPDGLMIVDLFGGTEAEDAVVDRKRIKHPKLESFDYYWELHDFNPIDRIANFSIHFGFKNGTGIQSAFRYRWRMWTIPELREMMEEAGLLHSEVLWEDDDGTYFKATREPNDPTWVAYIIAGKRKWSGA